MSGKILRPNVRRRPASENVRSADVEAAASVPVPDAPDKGPPSPSRRPIAWGKLAANVFTVLSFVTVGTAMVWGAHRYTHESPRFSVREVECAGGKQRSDDDLAAIAGVAKGANIFSIDLASARARLAADPWIERAEVARKLPATISIRVVERTAAAVVAMPEGTYLAARDGSIIKRVEPGDPLDLCVITGLSMQALAADREGVTRTIVSALDLAADYGNSPLAARATLEEVHVASNQDLTLTIGKAGTLLRMGAPPYRKKLERAARIATELERRKAKPDVIMLDDEVRPERVVVRMR